MRQLKLIFGIFCKIFVILQIYFKEEKHYEQEGFVFSTMQLKRLQHAYSMISKCL